jgi:hypothetical protein
MYEFTKIIFRLGGAMVLSVRRVLLSILSIMLVQCVASAQQQPMLVFPQFVTGADFVSTATLVNTNSGLTVSGTFSVYNQDGTPRAVTIAGKTAASFSVSIPPGGTAVLATTNPTPTGPVTAGMATFVSNYVVDGVVQFAYGGGEVGVLSAPLQTFATVVINTANGNDTGLAIVNPGTAPINLRLVQVDQTGAVVQTLDPPSLNPLPPNGQVSLFTGGFGFTNIANLSSGSIQILNKGAGQFAALALLIKNGALATTGIIDGVSGRLSPELLQGTFSGAWNNTTFSTTGGATLVEGVITSSQTVLAQLTLTGNVFGASAPAPLLFVGTYTANGFTSSGNSLLLGPVTMTVSANGAWTVTANSVPGGIVNSLSITGTARTDGFFGNYTVGLTGGGSATGTILMNHIGR